LASAAPPESALPSVNLDCLSMPEKSAQALNKSAKEAASRSLAEGGRWKMEYNRMETQIVMIREV
jgi:hypothetical protein